MLISKLEVVLRLIREEEKQGALMFKAAQDEFARAENALNQALSYRVEYEELSRAVRPNKFALVQLRMARSFLNNIDDLVENQRNVLRAKREALEAKREQWQALRARSKSIESVIASRSKSLLLTEEKKEQSRLDDLFGRRMPH